MRQLLTGNEAVARGAFEAGVHFAAAYPGTPSTEILETLAKYDDISAEWAPNEKVALESVIGASIAGGRAMASMKHVGLNVAADPFFTFAYTGVNGGAVIITADEPGQHSAQNEQDNRNYARSAKVPMFEPANSQECKDMVVEAYNVSEKYDCPVLIRMTTRVCHGKSIVECGDRVETPIKAYEKNVKKYCCVPANAKGLRRNLEVKLANLKDYAEHTPFNFVEENENTTIGVIASGPCYHYAKEAFGEKASYLKLGFSFPMPDDMITAFCQKYETIYVVEENDPLMEERVKQLGFRCHGKDMLPKFGEMTPEVIRKGFFGEEPNTITYNEEKVVDRPPTLCAGCPHRGFFYELGKHKDVLVSGDIGCYSLGFAKPYNAMDLLLCMGGGFSIGHGAQKVFNMTQEKKRVVSVLGDSTFLHSGITSLMDVVYNHSNTVSVILDNRITGMTGHQENPGTGYNAKGESSTLIDIEAVVRALGIKHIRTINPNNLKEVRETLDEFLKLEEPSVIITKWPCALKKFSKEDKENFAGAFTKKMAVNTDKCIGCKMCMKSGCPAISYDGENKKAKIDDIQCVGCGVCSQLCPKDAIEWKEA